MHDGKTVPYGRINGLDKPVSRIVFGTAIAPMLAGENADSLLDAVYSAGINTFDTARGYLSAEKSLGNWIKGRNNRDRVVVISKCGDVGPGAKVHIDRTVIEEELQKSLETLQTEYIDIYLLHRDDPNTPVSETITTLNEAKNAGKIKIFGVSNWTHERITEANEYAERNGLAGFCVSSPNYSLAIQVEDPWGGNCVSITGEKNEAARKWYTETQMPVFAYSSLARGFLSGRFKAGQREEAEKILDSAAQKGYLHDVNIERLKRAEEIAEREHCHVSEIAMRYVFSNDMNMFAIVSTEKPHRMESNIAAALSPLDEADIAFLETGKLMDG